MPQPLAQRPQDLPAQVRLLPDRCGFQLSPFLQPLSHLGLLSLCWIHQHWVQLEQQVSQS